MLDKFELAVLDTTEFDKGFTFKQICDRYCNMKGIKRCPSKRIEETINKLIKEEFVRLKNKKLYKISMFIGEGNYPIRIYLTEDEK